MVNIDNFERQNLLLNLMDKHRDFMVLAQTNHLNKQTLQQFEIMDKMVQEMMKANARQLGLYQDPET
jgi:hypothetical protein